MRVKALNPKRRLKKAVLRLSQMLWLKAAVACSLLDKQLQNEISTWPEGFSVFFKVHKDEPLWGIRKNMGSLHIIKAPIAFCDDIVVAFKSLDLAFLVFSGTIGIRRALAERRFDIVGNADNALSAVRFLMLAEKLIFRPKGRISRFALLSGMLKLKPERREVTSYDSEILRVS